ncbi:hypothetical protein [Botrimarina sp.]|uniref:hypothetical protein n=1 Tax=Botrimarina sp. TaxID=2795802 RepID=UPI0032EC7F6C
MKTPLLALSLIAAETLAAETLAADPWADRVVQYEPGEGVPPVFGSDPPVLFDRPEAALGAPTRQSVAFGGYVVSPFSPAGDPSEVVSLGRGGRLTLEFDEPVTDDPLNPFGVDLLIFGNAFFETNDFDFDAQTVVTGVASESGLVELSADGETFVTLTGAAPDGGYPTRGWADHDTFFPAGPGATPADFTLPVDPALDPVGLGPAGIAAGYGLSGGGLGVDLADWGISEVRFIRFSNPVGSLTTPEIDAVADVRPVPEVGALWLALAALPVAAGRRSARAA